MMLEFIPDTHTYLYDGCALPSVTQILDAEGFIDKTWFTEYGRDRGRMVHKATALDDMDDLNEESLDPVLVPYVEAWRKFKKDSGFIIEEIEVPKVELQFKFAGTPDRIGALNGRRTVLDIKHIALPWTALQLAAYECLDTPPLRRVAIELKDNGKYNLKEYKDRQDRMIFFSALACFNWKKNNNGRK